MFDIRVRYLTLTSYTGVIFDTILIIMSISFHIFANKNISRQIILQIYYFSLCLEGSKKMCEFFGYFYSLKNASDKNLIKG